VEENKMATWIDFSISSAYEAKYPGVAFGLTLISDCRPLIDSTEFDQYKRNLLRKMRKRETLAGISQRIDIYDRFFQGFGFECPLPKHLQRTIQSGFPRYNLMVDAHFMAEMCAGILVAVTDFDRIEGGLVLDVAHRGGLARREWDGDDRCTREAAAGAVRPARGGRASTAADCHEGARDARVAVGQRHGLGARDPQ